MTDAKKLESTPGHLWGLAVEEDPEGCGNLEQAQREKIIALLRATADTLDQNPGNIKGLVFIVGGCVKEAVNSDTGIEVSGTIIGSPPAVAAAYVQFEPVGKEAYAQASYISTARAFGIH